MSKNRGNSQRIQHRRGSAAEWTVNNPILFAGELGYETDTTRIKFGDGVTQWVNLAYVGQFGASDLDSLTDVSITSPASGAVLRYDGTSWTDYVLSKSDVGLPSVPNVDATARANHTGTQPASTITGLAASATTDTTNAANIGSGVLPAARLPAATTTTVGGVVIGSGLGVASGTVSVTYGTASGTACQGNDARLSDARVPTSHTHGNITNAGAIGSTSGQIVVTTTSGVLTTAATISSASVSGLGTIATQNANSVAITGGSVNGTTIGATTASTGVFTAVTVIGAGDAGFGAVTTGGNIAHVTLQNQATGGRSYSMRAWGSAGSGAFGIDDLTANERRFTIGSTGNVGIGKTNPAYRWDVWGESRIDSSANAVLRYGRNGANTWAVYVDASDNYILFSDAAGQERLRIAANGNVGIGTTNPAQRLHLYHFTADCVATVQGRTTSLGGSGRAAVQIDVDGHGGFAIQTDATSGTRLLRVISNGGYGSGSVDCMAVTSGGNVGIGTTSPGAKLHVAGSGQGIFIEDTGANRAVLGLYAFNNELRIQGTAYVNAAQPLTVWTANAERMRIDANGNVGIGTASPTTRLDVAAVSTIASGTWAGGTDFVRLLAASGSAFSEQAIAFQEAGTNVGAKIGVKNQGNGAYDIVFANRDNSSLTSAFAERARITAAGNVGIGTTSPARTLHVNSAGFFAARIQSSDTTACVLEIAAPGRTWELAVNGTTGTTGVAGTFYIWQQGAGGGPRFAIDPTGNVGIGTASPAISSGVGLHLSGSTLRLGTARTPASSTATGNQGEVCWDSSYLYVCIATNTWRRIALTTW